MKGELRSLGTTARNMNNGQKTFALLFLAGGELLSAYALTGARLVGLAFAGVSDDSDDESDESGGALPCHLAPVGFRKKLSGFRSANGDGDSFESESASSDSSALVAAGVGLLDENDVGALGLVGFGLVTPSAAAGDDVHESPE